MADVAIRVEGLGKRYRLGERRRYKALRDTLTDGLKAPARALSSRAVRRAAAGGTGDETSLFWALKDVSFDIEQGEVVGIIGRNGAGKSTLLKILSRITEPTTGRAEIRGRVGSLLEVGTGFHPELSGRENIYLNGAVLGMSRREIERKFDEIVAFAEVEKFIDTPVKFYSSGMYLRLAFAVAAHLEPEILLVDEVLAVGDAAFQKKCLEKIREVTKTGRTALFVSHNMAAINALCRQTIFLNRGTIEEFGETDRIIKSYLTRDAVQTGSWRRETPIPSAPGIYFETVDIVDRHGAVTGHVGCTDPFSIRIGVSATEDITKAMIAVRVTNQEGVAVFSTTNCDVDKAYRTIRSGQHHFTIDIPANFLSPGLYSLILGAITPGVQAFDILDGQVSVSVEDTGSHATILRDERLGIVTPVFEWRTASDA